MPPAKARRRSGAAMLVAPIPRAGHIASPDLDAPEVAATYHSPERTERAARTTAPPSREATHIGMAVHD